MSKTTSKRSTTVVLLFTLTGLLVIIFGFLYKERYLNCLSVDLRLCLTSSKYVSATKQFIFRYPKDYPITSKTEEALTNEYGFNKDEFAQYNEWVNFSSEFYPNAGGERLGSVVVIKDTPFKSISEYVNKEQEDYEDYNKLSDAHKHAAPNFEFLKISGKDAVRIIAGAPNPKGPGRFSFPGDTYILVENGKLYTISFDYDEYYHKEPIQYYENSKKIILSTFKFTE